MARETENVQNPGPTDSPPENDLKNRKVETETTEPKVEISEVEPEMTEDGQVRYDGGDIPRNRSNKGEVPPEG
jgi:hypothetical protein